MTARSSGVRFIVPVLLSSLLLAVGGCSAPAQREAPVDPADIVTENRAQKIDLASELPTLRGISSEDLTRANMIGRGCRFHTGPARAILFVGDDGRAAANLDSGMHQMTVSQDYEGSSAGAVVTSELMRLAVSPTPGGGEQISIGTIKWPATLTMSNDRGAQREVSGDWICGS